jgi:cytochrome-b5 reductase
MERLSSGEENCRLSQYSYVRSPDVRRLSPINVLINSYRFALPEPTNVLGLPIGQHISVQAEINGKHIQRSYTPITSDDDLGHFDLMVKSYEKGNISRYLSLLSVGDHVKIKGPKGQFNYRAGLSTHLGMIAGGTGITPMLQIVRAIVKNPHDHTHVALIYANVSFDDILLKEEIDHLAEAHPKKFTVYYTLNEKPAQGWDGGVGFVTKEMIQEHMPAPSENIKVLLCGEYHKIFVLAQVLNHALGPPPMMDAMKYVFNGAVDLISNQLSTGKILQRSVTSSLAPFPNSQTRYISYYFCKEKGSPFFRSSFSRQCLLYTTHYYRYQNIAHEFAASSFQLFRYLSDIFPPA